jgi:hypothetical protein
MQQRIKEVISNLEPAIRQTCTMADLAWQPYPDRVYLQDFRLPEHSLPPDTFYSLSQLDKHLLITKRRLEISQGVSAHPVVKLNFVEVVCSSTAQDPLTPETTDVTVFRRFKTLGDALWFVQEELPMEQKSHYVNVLMEWSIEELQRSKMIQSTFDVQVIVFLVGRPEYDVNTRLLWTIPCMK